MPKTSLLADADCDEVISYLTQQRMFPISPSATCVAKMREVHRLTLSIILWRFRLKKLPEHGQVFIEEIASDALQILPQLATGFVKPFKLLARGMIENTLRHIYFLDHKIEFEKMNRLPKWYVSVEELFDYAKEYPAIQDAEKSFDALARLKSAYGELSAGVHGRRVQDFQMKTALSKLVYSDEAVEAEAKVLSRSVEAVNFMLAVFHNDQFRTFEAVDRRIILSTMGQAAKQTLAAL